MVLSFYVFDLPGGNIEINKGAAFAQKSSTSSYDYKTGFSNSRPVKVVFFWHQNKSDFSCYFFLRLGLETIWYPMEGLKVAQNTKRALMLCPSVNLT